MIKDRLKTQDSRFKIQIANFKLLLVTCIFLLVTCNLQLATASETISLSSLIEEAKKNNLEILAYQQRVKAKEHKVKIEGILDDPQFKVEVMDIPKGDPLDLGASMQTRYAFSQMFPFPGKLSLKQSMARKETMMAISEVHIKEIEVITMLKRAYFDYAFITESIKITEELKELISQMVKVAEIRYATNQASQQDVIKAQVELTMLNNELIYLRAEKDILTARINSILNRSSTAPLGDPEDIKNYRVYIRTEDLIIASIEENPLLKAMEYDIQARETEIELNKKNYYPDFMVGVAPIQRDGRFDSWDLMFGINIPFWWNKYDSQVAEARANAEVLRTKLKAEENMKSFEVMDAAIKVDAADRVRSLYETSIIPQAEISFQSAMANYQTGKVDFLTVLDSQRALKRTRIEHIRSIADYRKNIALLEKAVGEDLETVMGGR